MAYTDQDFRNWLDAMEPFLKGGNSLYYCLEMAGLSQNKNVIYAKYNQNDWFREKVDHLRSRPGELVASIFSKLVSKIYEKVASDMPLSEEDFRNLRWFGEKARVAQPFFVTRNETAETKPNDVGKVIDNLDTDYDDVARQAQKQMVAANPLVQNQEQTGPNGTVSAQPNTAPTPSGAGEPSVQQNPQG